MRSLLGKPVHASPIKAKPPTNTEKQEPSVLLEMFQGLALHALGAGILAEAIDAANFSNKGGAGSRNIKVINPDPIAQIDPSRMFRPK